MIRLSTCVLGIWLMLAPGAFAAEANQAEMDKAVADIDAARAGVRAALDKAPLGFRRVLFVKDVPEGFAAYHPRADNVFGVDEPLIVYAEPVGVIWKKNGDEFASNLTVDFEIRTRDGQVLAGQRGFGEFALEAREPPLDYMSHVKLEVTGAPAGAYILGLTIHDTNSGKSSSTDLPFEIK